ncbi:N-acetylmuramic acid 6-phosphate etherase [Devosia enhydra]|uniref:N-acetylmuramic acid 6-phosphate etherase n=1 Tax=Devosia enhydra TaxID=665118 RepID=A0A1K2I0A6_9HYPH|nr:N-acetylmuramic acid 6-phosphate etherase [Devosia enhydra]SFZ85806.1 N-acetylmuramic acid 6-phosphate etherase [Devosia enhydra]
MSTTETASARFSGIEDWSPAELVDGIVEGQFAAIAAVKAASASIAEAIERSAERLEQGGRLIYVGAGTSGRIATQDAAELPPTFNWPYERAVPVMAGGETALTHAAEGAEDDGPAAREALAGLGLSANDVVIAVAASGRTPFAIAALEMARETGALAIGIFCNPGAAMVPISDIPILLHTGPELIAGSTRMKAGTAQKAALNCLSTGVMVRLGYVYSGLMVEMRATNIKLHHRAILMVARLTGASEAEAEKAFAASGDSIKLATVMLAKGLDRSGAEALVAAAGGNLRRAMQG